MSGLLEVLGLKMPAGAALPPPAAGAMPPPPASGGAASSGTAVPAATSAPPVTSTATPVAPPPDVAAQYAAIEAALAAARTGIAGLKTAKLKAALAKEIETVGLARDKVKALAASAAAAVVGRVVASAQALETRCAGIQAGEPAALVQQAQWAVAPVAALTTLLSTQPAESKTIMAPVLETLKKKLTGLASQIEKGDFIASAALASEIYNGCEGAKRAVGSFAADFPAYKVERDKAEKAIKSLRTHAQAAQIQGEIDTLEQRLLDADGVASRADAQGWQKATGAVKAIPELAARAKTLADALGKVAAKLPVLTKQFQADGADAAAAASMARYATKMLVEEKCTDAEAVKMAKDAAGFVAEGLRETDALMSARVKKSLLASGTPEAVAQEIGKNLRAGGSSTADDAKAVAEAMKKFPKKVLEDLNKAGIQTECCRGPVTEAIPELAGVQPRGWPAGSTWDKVPGVYSGTVKKVVVGTMEKDGKRHVPGKGEGPIPHGTPNLIGHEGGHAFDAADGPLKSKNAKFLAARHDDIATGKPLGMWGHRDDYFLTTAEGGTNDAGATSETFAESFAMHLGTSPKWPKLEAFWVANPWGA